MIWRTILWSIAGAIVLPAWAFVMLMVMLGALDVCAAHGEHSACTTGYGLTVIAAAPIGALLFGWLSRVDRPRDRSRQTRFGRAAKDGDRL